MNVVAMVLVCGPAFSLLCAAMLKVADRHSVEEAIQNYKLPPPLNRLASANMLIASEAGIGALVVIAVVSRFEILALATTAAMTLLFGLFGLFTVRVLQSEPGFTCSCFGAGIDEEIVSWKQALRAFSLGIASGVGIIIWFSSNHLTLRGAAAAVLIAASIVVGALCYRNVRYLLQANKNPYVFELGVFT